MKAIQLSSLEKPTYEKQGRLITLDLVIGVGLIVSVCVLYIYLGLQWLK